jgi:aldehyde dehydrogenase (NAD+)
VGQIIPWNFPLLMQAWKLGPALATGCTVVMKSSEKTPLTALMMAELIHEAGYPKGVFNMLSGLGTAAGEPIARHMDIDKVAFTGSTAVGKGIQVAAGQTNMKRVSLELGGKSPLIVCDDADLDKAVGAAQIGLFLNSGQCCIASSRLFVHESVYDEFVAKITAPIKDGSAAWTIGTGMQGPQVDKIQFDKVMGFIEKGKSEGANLATGGSRHGDKGYFVEPTVFTDVQDDMTIMKEEIFGPVMSIAKFSDLNEAIDRANNTHYGLGAGIITENVGRAHKAASRLAAGTVYVNCYDVFDVAAPFGGFGESGHGRELGHYGLDAYTEVKTVILPIN